MKSLHTYTLKALITISLLSPLVSYAQTPAPSTGPNPINNPPAQYTLLEPLPCVPGGNVQCTPGTQQTSVSFQTYVQYAFNLLIALAAVAAVVMIIWGGFEYMLSAASSGKKDGSEKVKNAVYGLILILASYLILRTVDPRLVAIPSTLVAPLNINYTKETSSFFSQIDSQASQLTAQNTNLREDILGIDQKIKDLETKKAELQSQLAQNSNNEEMVSNLNAQIADINNQENDLEGQSLLEIAEGSMNSSIIGAMGISTRATGGYGNGVTASDYTSAIDATRGKYYEQLIKLGQPDKAQIVNDYAVYAVAMTNINSTVLTSLAQSPTQQAIIQSAEGFITVLGTGIGAASSGVVGGSVGFIGTTALNSFVNGKLQSVHDNTRIATAKQVVTIVQTYVDQIQNVQVKNALITQAQSVLKALLGQ